jgi:hypothetical protein
MEGNHVVWRETCMQPRRLNIPGVNSSGKRRMMIALLCITGLVGIAWLVPVYLTIFSAWLPAFAGYYLRSLLACCFSLCVLTVAILKLVDYRSRKKALRNGTDGRLSRD